MARKRIRKRKKVDKKKEKAKKAKTPAKLVYTVGSPYPKPSWDVINYRAWAFLDRMITWDGIFLTSAIWRDTVSGWDDVMTKLEMTSMLNRGIKPEIGEYREFDDIFWKGPMNDPLFEIDVVFAYRGLLTSAQDKSLPTLVASASEGRPAERAIRLIPTDFSWNEEISRNFRQTVDTLGFGQVAVPSSFDTAIFACSARAAKEDGYPLDEFFGLARECSPPLGGVKNESIASGTYMPVNAEPMPSGPGDGDPEDKKLAQEYLLTRWTSRTDVKSGQRYFEDGKVNL